MCGIIGLLLTDTKCHVNQLLVDGLTILQHRGQDAAGIVTLNKGRLHLLKNSGTVHNVFTQSNILDIPGPAGIGHVRYPTAGGSCVSEAQPLYTNSPFGIACAHNGNLTNSPELAASMFEDMRHINTNSDTELLLNTFAEELQRKRLRKISPDEIFDTVRSLMRRIKGAYSVILLINGIGMLAFRDPYGIRPLCFGSRKNPTTRTGGISGEGYVFASESVAIDAMISSGFSFERDVGPGEAVLATLHGEFFIEQCQTTHTLSPCIFEYVYFARPDSILDGVSVHTSRLNMGDKLAKKIMRVLGENLDIDVVMPIPDTSRVSALQCATTLNRPYREGYIKNRYIARTFIMPGQEMRRKTVRLKLNTIRAEFASKVVLMVDDSIVRGTTCTEIIQMAREAGAKKIYFASAAPPVRYPNLYGIDIPSKHELIANDRTEEEIAVAIGADMVIYNDLCDLEESVKCLNPLIQRFDSSCFNGIYVTPEVTPELLRNVEESRGRGRRSASFTLPITSGIHCNGHGGGVGSAGSADDDSKIIDILVREGEDDFETMPSSSPLLSVQSCESIQNLNPSDHPNKRIRT